MSLLASGIFISAVSKTYFVDQKHPAADDQNSGTADLPWKTIGRANQVLTAGDSALIKAGVYNSSISPVNSGSPLRPITYRNFNADSVIISNTVYGIYLDGKSNIVIHGIAMKNCDRFLYMRNRASHNTIAHCTFDSAKLTNGQTATWAGSVISGNARIHAVVSVLVK
jgi:hypothetical protein